MKDQLNTTTIVMDSHMRAVLIRAAKNIEKMLSEGKITTTTNLTTRTEIGLNIHVQVVQKDTEKPAIFSFTYSLNQTQFQTWANGMTLLKEGPISFMMKGIQIVIQNSEKLSASGFSITHEDEEIWLELWNQPITFTIHRDLFQGEEWVVLLNS